MQRTRTFHRLTVVAAGAAAVLALSVGPASAASDYDINAPATGTTAVTATGSGLILEDTYLGPFGTSGNTRIIGCALSASGAADNGGHAFTAGTVVTDAAVKLDPTSASFTGCDQPSLFGPVSLTPAPGSSWRLGLRAKTATGGAAVLSGLALRLRGTAGSAYCQADLSGYLQGTYDDASGTFTIDQTVAGLTFDTVTETGALCNTIGIVEGDPGAFSGTIDLTPAPDVS
ncbi:hypothetical protein [Pimelobacter sp. 30-1]|uniref:hypothetical protein n=1 Tax=Pimelobacter sp. 30-1 TaxID=2004991 RepID=UPI001C05358B|nr:hypothetical protein [Pimelobacter sp. 30-1]MBU2694862.1 hypothetical protein [Pimelobacter sp. 30-1]